MRDNLLILIFLAPISIIILNKLDTIIHQLKEIKIIMVNHNFEHSLEIDNNHKELKQLINCNLESIPKKVTNEFKNELYKIAPIKMVRYYGEYFNED